MKEIIELRINYDYADLLFQDEGKNIGTSVRVVKISSDDPRILKVPIIHKELKMKYNRAFFFSWEISRKYNSHELSQAKLFHVKIKSVFEPAGEECGTIYDETVACQICGSYRRQLGPLILKKGSIPKKDISKTIAGEIVVSEKFVETFKHKSLTGLKFEPILYKNRNSGYFQLVEFNKLKLTTKTLAGNSPFESTYGSEGGTYDISGYTVIFEKEVYICPLGHLIGLNLISELSVYNSNLINEYDFFASEQTIGVKRGLLRPEPIYICSPKFRNMVIEEKLTGFDFEIAHIDGRGNV